MNTREEMTIDRDSRKQSRTNRLRRMIGLAMFLSIAIALLALVGYVAKHRQSLQRELSSHVETRDRLQVIVDQLTNAESQAASDKRVVTNLLRHCRAAEDIPDLQSDRIVAMQKDLDTLCIYIPDGAHTLEIQCEWGPSSTKQSFTAEKILEPVGEKTWHVSLLPSAGYWLKLRADRKGEPIQWDLTSNHPEFERQQETLPLEGFQYRGASYSFSRVIQFPNQVNAVLAQDLEAVSSRVEGVSLMNTTFRGPIGDEPYTVEVAVRLSSEGPACLSASDAIRAFVLQTNEYLLPYEGGGKYVIKTTQPSDDATQPVTPDLR